MFDYSQNNYHPDKDNEPGSYEWWYTDAELDNGYVLQINFMHTDGSGKKYGDYLKKYAQDPSTPYNALDYANMKMSLTDDKNNLLFIADKDFSADQVKLSMDRVEGAWGDKCHIEIKETGALPELHMDVELEDGKGNIAKASAVFSPMIEGVKIGSGAVMEAIVKGKHLYHKCIYPMPTCKVKVHFVLKDSNGKSMEIDQTGLGYHDHNWGNHPMNQTVDRWYWGRIAEPDLTMVYAKVWNLVQSYPEYKPCLLAYRGNIITTTEQIDIIEGKRIKGYQDLIYTTEPIISFLDGSGVKGEVKITNLSYLSELPCYLRFIGNYDMDIETAYGRIKRKGKTVFEYADLGESLRRAIKA